jgi:addiction module RelB/DinJ family antitoxin
MDMQNDVRVTFRVEKDLKEQAETLFNRLGMNMSTALNIFLRKAVDEEAIPFPVSTKNAVYGSGYTSADISSVFVAAVQNEVAEKQRKGLPVARYDTSLKQAYLQFSDGSVVYVTK